MIDVLPGLGTRAAYVKQALRDKLLEHHAYIREHGDDMPDDSRLGVARGEQRQARQARGRYVGGQPVSGRAAWPRRAAWLAGAAALALAAVAASAPAVLTALSTQAASELRFVPDPAHEGYETVVTVGDPSKPGVYAVQTRLPANTTILPHTHGEKWRIGTVLSGTLHYAQGEKFDETKLQVAAAGQRDRRAAGRAALRAHRKRAGAAQHRGRRAGLDGAVQEVSRLRTSWRP